MRVLAPARALADELDLRLALSRHQLLERRRGRDDLGPRHLAESDGPWYPRIPG